MGNWLNELYYIQTVDFHIPVRKKIYVTTKNLSIFIETGHIKFLLKKRYIEIDGEIDIHTNRLAEIAISKKIKSLLSSGK